MRHNLTRETSTDTPTAMSNRHRRFRRRTTGLLACFAALATLGATFMGPGAGAAFAEGEGATVFQDFRCSVAPFATGLPERIFTQDSQATLTPSGNSVVVCHFEVPEALTPDRTIVNEGFICNTPAGRANMSRVIVTPGGRATVVCQVNGTP